MMDISKHEVDALRLIGGHPQGGKLISHGAIFERACSVLAARGLITVQPQLTDEGKAMLDRLDRDAGD